MTSIHLLLGIKIVFKVKCIQFQLKQKKPIGLFIPPSYLEPLIQKNKLLLPVVKWLENAFGNIGFLANYSDHIYIEMKLK